MRSILEKLSVHFTLSSPAVGYPFIWICVLIIWLTVVACAYTSVFSKPYRLPAKLIWCAAITLLPLVGLALYLPFALNEELFPYFGFWRKPKT